MSVLLPKRDGKVDPTHPLFFFAGPVRGGGDWQYRAYQELQNQLSSRFCAAIPMRYEDGHPLLSEQLSETSNPRTFERQLAWENHHMDLAAGWMIGRRGCLLFWLGNESKEDPHPGPQPYAMSTRRELGKWGARLESRRRLRIVVGAEPEFFGLDEFERELDEAFGSEFPIHSTLEDTVRAAVARSSIA